MRKKARVKRLVKASIAAIRLQFGSREGASSPKRR
jgi:hypothetical protein